MSAVSSKNWVEMAMVMIARDGAVVRASLAEIKGSAPREAGAMMLITPSQIWQSIGGGALEYDMMRRARTMINTAMIEEAPPAWTRQIIKLVLGPDMGQCCGGQVRVLLEYFGPNDVPVLAGLAAASRLVHPLAGNAPLKAADGRPDGPSDGMLADGSAVIAPVALTGHPVFLYGAGHIGRALVPQLLALDCDLHWIDVADDRFPERVPDGARRVMAADPTVIAAHAPSNAIHLVITHDHALDEAICHRILTGSGFARLGLIGSATKAARFRSRLGKAGVSADQLERLVCPVGLAAISGKQPARVALSIAAAVAIWQQELDETG